eukprot:TRINITY_DN389_c0_g1_i2.p2 TRINITY_DN389_c0_g1~~TRINITY_DN389_c0_g1_i2.p2  ORF type:complete len:136 (-),score=23.42 TRINITY_DN389_c0_g1_i2:178-585(-)
MLLQFWKTEIVMFVPFAHLGEPQGSTTQWVPFGQVMLLQGPTVPFTHFDQPNESVTQWVPFGQVMLPQDEKLARLVLFTQTGRVVFQETQWVPLGQVMLLQGLKVPFTHLDQPKESVSQCVPLGQVMLRQGRKET